MARPTVVALATALLTRLPVVLVVCDAGARPHRPPAPSGAEGVLDRLLEQQFRVNRRV